MNYFQLKEDADNRIRDRIARLLAKLFFSFMVFFVDKKMHHYKLYSHLLDTVGYDVEKFNLQLYDRTTIIKAALEVQRRPIEVTDSEYNKVKQSKQHLKLLIDNFVTTRTNAILKNIDQNEYSD